MASIEVQILIYKRKIKKWSCITPPPRLTLQQLKAGGERGGEATCTIGRATQGN